MFLSDSEKLKFIKPGPLDLFIDIRLPLKGFSFDSMLTNKFGIH